MSKQCYEFVTQLTSKKRELQSAISTLDMEKGERQKSKEAMMQAEVRKCMIKIKKNDDNVTEKLKARGLEATKHLDKIIALASSVEEDTLPSLRSEVDMNNIAEIITNCKLTVSTNIGVLEVIREKIADALYLESPVLSPTDFFLQLPEKTKTFKQVSDITQYVELNLFAVSDHIEFTSFLLSNIIVEMEHNNHELERSVLSLIKQDRATVSSDGGYVRIVLRRPKEGIGKMSVKVFGSNVFNSPINHDFGECDVSLLAATVENLELSVLDIQERRELLNASRHVLQQTCIEEDEEDEQRCWKVGDVCVARWNYDNVWYNAVVKEIQGPKYTVEFQDYGNEAEVDHDDIVFSLEDICSKELVDIHVGLDALNPVSEHVAIEEEGLAALNEDRKVNYTEVLVTEVTDEGKFYACNVCDGAAVEKLLNNLQEVFRTNPPLSGAYQPKENDLCAAKFVDDQWYRAKVEKIGVAGVQVLYIDYGNRASVPESELGSLPATFQTQGGYAKPYNLALTQLPPDEDLAAQAVQGINEELLDKTVKLNVEYKIGGESFVTAHIGDEDIGAGLVKDGLLMVDRKGGRKLAKLVKDYEDAMARAKKNHLNIWQYGDITQDDASEFEA